MDPDWVAPQEHHDLGVHCLTKRLLKYFIRQQQQRILLLLLMVHVHVSFFFKWPIYAYTVKPVLGGHSKIDKTKILMTNG